MYFRMVDDGGPRVLWKILKPLAAFSQNHHRNTDQRGMALVK